MSAFQKGQPRPEGAGRKKGSKNKKKIAKVSDLLAEKEINPAQKILDMLSDPAIKLSDKDKADVWLDLLSYCEAKPKAIEQIAGDDDEGLEGLENVSNEDLLRIVRSPSGVA